MARKVFISFLGATNYGACHYCIGDFDSGELRFIQEATLDYLCQSGTWTKKDVAYILMTADSWRKNWLTDGQRHLKTKRIIRQPGLSKCLRSRHFPMTLKPVTGLPDGDTEEEVMYIFQRVFELLRKGDELYFDITHGFRYLPMLIVVLGNYSKFLKDVKVKMISYGNYEGRDRKTNRARIMDLTVLSTLQDWTNAAGSFIRSGDSSYLAQLAKDKLLPLVKDSKRPDAQSARTLNELVKNLEKLTTDIVTCRGLNIEKGERIKGMKRHLNRLEDVVIKPMKPIIDRVKDEFADFNEAPDVMNGFHAVQWCINHGLLQQAATILEESVISYFCQLYGKYITCTPIKDRRDIITRALRIIYKGTPEDEWRLEKMENLPQLKPVVSKFLEDREKYMVSNSKGTKEHISATFCKLSDLRNDLDHNGMNDGPSAPDVIKKRTIKFFKRIHKCLSDKSRR